MQGVWHTHIDGFERRVAWPADKWFCVTMHEKVLVEEILVNYSDKSCWQGKFCEYGTVNKCAKYNFVPNTNKLVAVKIPHRMQSSLNTRR